MSERTQLKEYPLCQNQYIMHPYFFLMFPPSQNMHYPPYPKNLKTEVKVEEREVKQEVKEEYSSQEQEKILVKTKSIHKRKAHIYPGETKNYYKNMGQKLSNYIANNFNLEIIKEDPILHNFIRTDSQRFNRLTLEKLFKSKMARKIVCYFFGNFQWALPFVSQNKTDLEFYFRQQIYSKRDRKQD